MSKSMLFLSFLMVAPMSPAVVTPALAKQPICQENIREYCYEQQRSEDPMECIEGVSAQYLSECEALAEPKQRETSVVLWCVGNSKCSQEHGDRPWWKEQ